MRLFAIVPGWICLAAVHLAAQDNAEVLNRMKAMEERIKALEAEVQSLKAGQGVPAAPTPLPLAQAAPVAAPSLGGAGGAAAKALNPDISVIGNFVGAIGHSANRPTPSLQMRESEVGFQEVIDPYARGDFFISFGEQGVNLEEGYLTFTGLPAGLQIKAGKMRAAFGKVNTLHSHVLPWTDRPLVTQNLLSGEDGINDAGLSVSRILPAPKGVFLEATGQVFRGDTEGVFRADKRRDLSTVGHLRLYRDITESTNIDLGGSFARGHSVFADGWSQLYGADATVRWKPLRRSIYQGFVGRGELVWARTLLAPGQTIRPFGYYVSGDYLFNRRWSVGARFDRSQRGACLPTNPETTSTCDDGAFYPGQILRDTGGSFLLTYWASEFSQIRTQFRHTRYGEGRTANELLFQFMFSMGAHGAHPF